MKTTKRTLLVLVTVLLVFSTQSFSSVINPRTSVLPNPVLYFIGQELYETGGKQFIRYTYDVANKDAYPDDLFAASPDLPPCGQNTKAARTWIDIYDQSGKLRVPKGQTMKVLEGGTNSLYGMNWLVKGVIGSPTGK